MTVCAPSNIDCLIRQGLGYLDSPAAIVFSAMVVTLVIATLWIKKG